VWLLAAALQVAAIDSGHTVIDEFASRFVFFYTGYLMAPRVFALAEAVQGAPETAIIGLSAWGLINGVLVASGLAGLPVVSLALGFAGAAAVVSLSTLMAQHDLFKPVRYCGRNSIVIYLAFFLPMAASRTMLLRAGWIADMGTVSVMVTAAGVVGALALFWAARRGPLRFLFERPERLHLAPRPVAMQPAE
jgi:uncharacterized membrane protein YcfT